MENKKLEALRQMIVDSAALNDKESVERRLLASLSHDYGTSLVTRFPFIDNRGKEMRDKHRTDAFRKSAYNLLWSCLESFHSYSTMKLNLFGNTRTLKSLCFSLVSTAIAKKKTSGK